MNLKTALELLDIIDRQNKLIAELVNENLEQENMINQLMQDHLQLSDSESGLRNKSQPNSSRSEMGGLFYYLQEGGSSCNF